MHDDPGVEGLAGLPAAGARDGTGRRKRGADRRLGVPDGGRAGRCRLCRGGRRSRQGLARLRVRRPRARLGPGQLRRPGVPRRRERHQAAAPAQGGRRAARDPGVGIRRKRRP